MDVMSDVEYSTGILTEAQQLGLWDDHELDYDEMFKEYCMRLYGKHFEDTSLF